MSILRIQETKAEFGYPSHASVYNNVRLGLCTTGVKIGQRSVGWPSQEIAAINHARIAGKSDDEIRQLVNRLHAKRLEPLAA